jgi:tRNA A37 threonylcarbamoyladenosine synthetase subunit TsaC/SUA5/YrdC
VLQSDDFIRAFEKHVDLIVDDEQEVRFEPSTIIDLSEDRVKILREGKDYQACMDALANSQLDIENIE